MASRTVHLSLAAAGVVVGAAVACIWQATRPLPAVAWAALADIEAQTGGRTSGEVRILLHRTPQSPRLTSCVWRWKMPLPIGPRRITRGPVRLPDDRIVGRVTAALDPYPQLFAWGEDPADTPGWRRFEFFEPEEIYVPFDSPGKSPTPRSR